MHLQAREVLLLVKLQALARGYMHRNKSYRGLAMFLFEERLFPLVEFIQNLYFKERQSLSEDEEAAGSRVVERPPSHFLPVVSIDKSAITIAKYIYKYIRRQQKELNWLATLKVKRIFFLDCYLDDAMQRLESKFSEELAKGDIAVSEVPGIRSYTMRSRIGKPYQLLQRWSNCMHASERTHPWWHRLADNASATSISKLCRTFIPPKECSSLNSRISQDPDRIREGSNCLCSIECSSIRILQAVIRDFFRIYDDIPVFYDVDILPYIAAVQLQKVFRSFRARTYARTFITTRLIQLRLVNVFVQKWRDRSLNRRFALLSTLKRVTSKVNSKALFIDLHTYYALLRFTGVKTLPGYVADFPEFMLAVEATPSGLAIKYSHSKESHSRNRKLRWGLPDWLGLKLRRVDGTAADRYKSGGCGVIDLLMAASSTHVRRTVVSRGQHSAEYCVIQLEFRTIALAKQFAALLALLTTDATLPSMKSVEAMTELELLHRLDECTPEIIRLSQGFLFKRASVALELQLRLSPAPALVLDCATMKTVFDAITFKFLCIGLRNSASETWEQYSSTPEEGGIWSFQRVILWCSRQKSEDTSGAEGVSKAEHSTLVRIELKVYEEQSRHLSAALREARLRIHERIRNIDAKAKMSKDFLAKIKYLTVQEFKAERNRILSCMVNEKEASIMARYDRVFAETVRRMNFETFLRAEKEQRIARIQQENREDDCVMKEIFEYREYSDELDRLAKSATAEDFRHRHKIVMRAHSHAREQANTLLSLSKLPNRSSSRKEKLRYS